MYYKSIGTYILKAILHILQKINLNIQYKDPGIGD